MSIEPTGLPLDQLDELAERVADLVAERLAVQLSVLLAPVVTHLADPEPHERADEFELLTAKDVAVLLGVTRDWVYRHRTELGARPMTGGQRPRLRYEREAVLEALPACPPSSESAAGKTPQARRSLRSHRHLRMVDSECPLLPIRHEDG